MTSPYPHLLDPLDLGHVTLRNHLLCRKLTHVHGPELGDLERALSRLPVHIQEVVPLREGGV